MLKKLQEKHKQDAVFSDKSIAIIVKILKILLTIVAIYTFISILVFAIISQTILYTEILNLLIDTCVLFGLYKRKQWTIPLLLFLNAVGLLRTIFFFSSFSVLYLISMLSTIFWLYFFSRRRVREYFHYKGLTLF